MFYSKKEHLTGKIGNNAFSYEERASLLGKDPSLVIPARKQGTIEDIRLGTDITFEEVVDGQLFSKTSLDSFIEFSNPFNDTPIVLFDNHNHALFFWAEALQNGYIAPGATLLHIDQHKDMREPAHYLGKEHRDNLDEIYRYTNHVLNVGNFIKPAVRLGIIGEVHLLDNEPSFQKEYTTTNTIVDIDLDLFAEEMDYMDFEEILPVVRNMLQHADFTTIATSPFFIEQKRALHWLHRLFSD